MKTLKRKNEFIRVDDKKANDIIKNEQGWEYSPKSEWKEWKNKPDSNKSKKDKKDKKNQKILK